MNGWLYPLLVVSAFILAVGLVKRFGPATEDEDADPKPSPKKKSEVGTKIKNWMKDNWSLIAIAIGGTVIFNWLWYALAPNMWNMWWKSSSFWPMTVAIIFTSIIAGRKDTLAKVARYLLVGEIVLGLLIGGTSYASATWCWAGSKTYTEDGFRIPCPTKGKSASTGGTASSSPTTRKFSGNARDYKGFAGPERDSVMEYFSDIPTMADIAAAESHFNQFSDSTVRTCEGVLEHKNTNGSVDIGVMQINSIHLDEAKRLGMDVCTLRGNMEYARHLHEVDKKAGRDGFNDWNASRPVWQDGNKTTNVSKTVVEAGRTINYPESILVEGGGKWTEWMNVLDCAESGLSGIEHKIYSKQVNDDADENIVKIHPGITVPIASTNVYRMRIRSDSTASLHVLVQCNKQ